MGNKKRRSFQGIARGKVIELEEELPFKNGEPVTGTVKPVGNEEPFDPAPQELENALFPGVFYEISQMMHCLSARYEGMHIFETVQHACLESTLLHARVLLDFFWPRKSSRPGDVTCQPFGFPAAHVELDRDRLDKDLAHLTFESVNRPDKNWRVHGFLPILERCQQFVEHVIDRYPGYAHVRTGVETWRTLGQDLEATIARIRAIR